jgi:fused signal recognition particle receptor
VGARAVIAPPSSGRIGTKGRGLGASARIELGQHKTAMITLFPKDKPSILDSEPTLLDRLKDSVSKTRSEIATRIEGIFGGGVPDAEQLRRLENALLGADLGVRTTKELVEAVREKASREPLSDPAAFRQALKNELLSILNSVNANSVNAQSNGGGASTVARKPLQTGAATSPSSTVAVDEVRPRVLLIVGVNGTGKTTTIGKLAHRLRKQGASVLLCAGDTFRAAAIEQLAVWSQRTGAELIQQKPGADPAAVVFDALTAARARNTDVVILDTAGRLQTKSNLMAELEKIKRTAARLVQGAPHEVLLVLDATTGQNGLAQAREFTSVAGVTGIVLTKLDGTARGGIVVPIMRELGLPVRFVGTGESADDLVPFDAETFVNSIFD